MSTSRVCSDGLLQQILSTGAARTLPDAAFHRLLPASTAEAAIGSSLTMHLPAPADHLGAAAVVSGVCLRLAALYDARVDHRWRPPACPRWVQCQGRAWDRWGPLGSV